VKSVEGTSLNGNNKTVLIVICCLLAAVAILITAIAAVSAEKPLPEGYDPAGRAGMLFSEKYEGDKNDKTVLSYRINPVIEFSSFDAKGAVMIENPTKNSVDMTVQIVYPSNGGEYLLYSTGLLPPSSHISYDRLDVELAAGEYPCYAVITGFDPDTGAELGHINCDLTVIIHS